MRSRYSGSKPVSILLVLAMISVVFGTVMVADSVQAEDTEVCLSWSISGQGNPAIYGNIVVWNDYRYGDSDIVMYDLETETETFITSPPVVERSEPAIYGNYIVWSELDIFLYNIRDGTTRQLTWEPAFPKHDLAICGDTIVYSQFAGPGDDDIYAYSISTNTSMPVCVQPNLQSLPDIYGDTIVWQDNRNGIDYDIYGSNPSMPEFPIAIGPQDTTEPVIYENIVVYIDYSTDADIVYFNLETMSPSILAWGPLWQRFPDIWGDYIVWVSEDGMGDRDIWFYDFSMDTMLTIVDSPGSSMWPAIQGDIMVWMDGVQDDVYMTHIDQDHDGVYGWIDAFPQNSGEYQDWDGDGIGDNMDWDIDGDGIMNDLDAFPYNNTEWADYDGDGIGDETDSDIDNDGIPNALDADDYNIINDMPAILSNVNSTVTYVNGTVSSINTDVIGVQTMLTNLQYDMDDVNATVQQLQNDIDYLNLTLTGLMNDLADQLDGVNATLIDDIANSEVNILGELADVNASLAQGIQDSLADITSQIIDLNASLADDLSNILENMTGTGTANGDNSALQAWLEIVLAQLDANLTATNSTLHEQLAALDDGQGITSDKLDAINGTLDDLALLENIISDVSDLDAALEAGVDEINSNIDDIDTSGAQDEETGGIGPDQILLIIVLVISIISLAVNITGKRHHPENYEASRGEAPEIDAALTEVPFRDPGGEGPEPNPTMPLPVDGEDIPGADEPDSDGVEIPFRPPGGDGPEINLPEPYPLDAEDVPKGEEKPEPQMSDGPSAMKLTKEEEEEAMRNLDESMRKNAENVNKNEDFSSEDKNSKNTKKEHEDGSYDPGEYGEITKDGVVTYAERQHSSDRLD